MSVKEAPSVPADLYHAHHQDYQEDIPYWLALAENASGGVLELGCGTGRVLLPVLKAGVEANGLDRDMQMLRFLRRELVQAGYADTPLLQADMAAFNLARRFDLILLACNTYSALSAYGRQSALDCIQRHLTPGGRFCASIYNPQRLEQLEPEAEAEWESDFTHPSSGNPVQVSSAWRRAGDSFAVSWHYDHLLPDGKVERSSQTVFHSTQPWSAYQLELEQAGFAIESLHGDFFGGRYDDRAQYAVFAAVRKS